MQEWWNMFLAQDCKCAICKRHYLEFKALLAVDHCHRTNRVRQLLCKDCNTALGAILGAAVGGTVGVIIGNRMDKQAKKIQDDLGKAATVERIGEGIKVTFDSQLLFDFGKTDVKDQNKEELRKLAETLTQNPDTNLLIVGHTDNVGSNSFNQTLSKNRARAVSYQLTSAGVSSRRLKVEGRGESQPATSNDTEYNRSLNRRVEIAIFANEKMKAEAGKEAI